MSDCPRCSAKAEHVGMVVPWNPRQPIEVQHVCYACDPLDGYGFSEEARDPHAALDAALAARLHNILGERGLA